MNDDIAIIIPAYKDIFLERSLQSLADQTNKNFNVYIGDDNSPSDLESICNRFKENLNIKYTKFPNNIGGVNLVKQWTRSVSLSNNEEWIWLFSDDDIADNNCVERFYATIEEEDKHFDVYRFNTRVIDDNDNILSVSNESPFIEASANMAYSILMGTRGNSMPDHIFSRDIYNEYGFVETCFAQAADWATSILFSSEKGLCTIKGAKINWRLGNYNISGTIKKNRKKAFKGYVQFSTWLIEHFNYLKKETNSEIKYEDMVYATEYSMWNIIQSHYQGLSISSYFDLYKYYFKKSGNLFSAFFELNKLYIKAACASKQ